MEKNQRETLIDYDAKLFFKFSTGTKTDERTYKVNFAQDTIQKAIEIGVKQAVELKQLSAFLINNFKELFKEEYNE